MPIVVTINLPVPVKNGLMFVALTGTTPVPGAQHAAQEQRIHRIRTGEIEVQESAAANKHIGRIGKKCIANAQCAAFDARVAGVGIRACQREHTGADLHNATMPPTAVSS